MREGSEMKLARGLRSGLLSSMGMKFARVLVALLALVLPPVVWGQTVEGESDDGSAAAKDDSISQKELRKNWNSFRGFGSNGHGTHATPPLTWSAEQSRNIVWKTPIAKHGMSSPVVWKKRLFLTGADEKSRDVYCFDTETGKLLWEHAVSGLPNSPADGLLPDVLEETGFAAPTVAANGHFVAAIFATGELVCVNMKGERVWAKHLGTPNNDYGHASSLICSRDLLFVQYDQKKDSKLFAFEMATGKPVWQAARDQMSWSSPILVENKGRTELILTDNKSVCSYDPKSGKRYWRVECLDGEVAPSAAYGGGIVFVAVDNSVASAIDVGNHAEEPRILWQWDGSLPDSASPLANEDYLILPTAFGVVTCLDSRTGKVFWEHEFNQGFCSSPIFVNDRVYIIDLSGNTHIFKLGKNFDQLGESDIGEPAYASPAFVGDRIYIRGLRHLFCVGEDVD
jgi:outer membrane protein assembly factor BamB